MMLQTTMNLYCFGFRGYKTQYYLQAIINFSIPIPTYFICAPKKVPIYYTLPIYSKQYTTREQCRNMSILFPSTNPTPSNNLKKTIDGICRVIAL